MTRVPAKASKQYPIKWKTTTTKVAKGSVIGQALNTGYTNIEPHVIETRSWTKATRDPLDYSTTGTDPPYLVDLFLHS